MKKIPMRCCVVTKERLPKKELIRIVRTSEGTVQVDPTGKMNGHGAYMKKSMEALDKARKTGILAKVLECPVDEQVYKELEAYMK